MAQVKFANNGKTTLNGAINSSVTSIVVTDGSVLPSLSGGDWFYLTIENNALAREIVKVTARTTNTLTVVRGQDGTAGAAWLSGDKAENRLTLAALNEMAAAVAGITPTAAFLTLVDDASVGAMATTLGLGTGSSVSFLSATVAGLYVAGAGTGQFMFFDSAAGTDLKRWDHLVGTGTYQFRLVNDANSVGNAVYTITRTAHTAATFNFGSIVTLQYNGGVIWHAGNDGAGSGLDADLLDGFNIGTSGATVPLLSTTNTWSLGQTAPSLAVSNTSSGAPQIIHYVSDAGADGKRWWNYANTGQMYFQLVNDAFNTTTTWMNVTRSGMTVSAVAFSATVLTHNGSTIWTLGNDGAGSGLDADLLDGKNTGTSGNVIGLLDGVNTYSGASIFSSTVTFNNYINLSSSAPEVRLAETTQPTDEKNWRLVPSGGDLYLQALNDAYSSASTPLRINRTGFGIDAILLTSTALTHNGSTIWTLGNDGAGSGLDADLLDGKNTGTSGNTIPLLDGNNTWSGSNTWTSTGFIISNTFPNIQMYDSDGALNQKYWRVYNNSGSFIVDMIDDAFTIGNIVMQFARTSYTSAVATFSNLSQFVVNTSSTITLNAPGATTIGTGPLSISSTAPDFRHFDSDAGLNLKQWRQYAYANGSMGWSLVDDGYTAENFWLTVVRTAHTSAVVSFPATVSSVNIASGYLYISGAAEPLQLNRTSNSQYSVKVLDNGTIRGYWGATSGYSFLAYSETAAQLLALTNAGNMSITGTFTAGVNLVATGVVYATNGFSATSGNSFEPQINLYNTNNDATGPYFILNKSPADTTMTNGDSIGSILFQGRGSSSVGQGVALEALYTGTRGTTWVGAQLSIRRYSNAGVYLATTFNNGGGISDDLIGTVWGSSNDGAGSGLDADLLDGLNPTSARVASTIVARNSGGAIFVQDITAERGDGTGVIYLNSAQTRYLYYDGTNYTLASAPLYVLGNPVWTLGNDGAGSGLDADLLDGINSSGFVTVNSTGLRVVTTAGMDISAGGSYSGAFGALEVYQNTVGSDALITFHCGSNWAGHFGLDGGLQDFAIGGWSWGSNVRYRLWHLGNDGAGSGLDADLLDGLNSATAATASTIAARDGSGQLTAADFIISSDARLKTDIYCITNALDKIEQIRGAEYTRLSTGKREIGVIAQDLEAAGLGLLVDNMGPHKSVKYQRVVAVLIEAVKELSAKVKQLEAR